MPDIKTPQNVNELPLALVKNMVSLATSGFGLVVALAWNQVIQNAVQKYIDPYLGKNGGMISLLIYALVMTVLAVIVTMQLAGLERKLEMLNEKVRNRTKAVDQPKKTERAKPSKTQKSKR